MPGLVDESCLRAPVEAKDRRVSPERRELFLESRNLLWFKRIQSRSPESTRSTLDLIDQELDLLRAG
jgi:hypothetical protein